MKVFIAAGKADIERKMDWFKKPICDQLHKRGIEFGFETKGSTQGLKRLTVPYGVHLPNNLATEWRDPKKRKKLEREVESVAFLNPAPIYAVLHGIAADPNQTVYYPERPNQKKKEFISEIGARDYFQSARELVDLILYLKKLGIPVALETVHSNKHVSEKGVALPKTFLDLNIGSLGKEVQKIAEETGCDTIVDWEHLSFALNFAKRKFHYANLSQEVPGDITPTERRLIAEYGIFLRKDWAPIFPEAGNLDFEKEMERIRAKISHVCGTYQGRYYLEYAEGKVTSHLPIYSDDLALRKYFKIALANGSEIFVLEIARPEDNSCFQDRPPDVQERSLENFCQILIEEL